MKYYTIVHKISDTDRLMVIKSQIADLFPNYFFLTNEISIVKTKHDHSEIAHTLGKLIHSPEDQLLVSESAEDSFSGWTSLEFESWFDSVKKIK